MRLYAVLAWEQARRRCKASFQKVVEQAGLLRVWPQREVEHRAVAAAVLLIEPFLLGTAVLLEHLNAVLPAVADIDEAVICDCDAMDGIAELLLLGDSGIIRRLLVVVWKIADLVRRMQRGTCGALPISGACVLRRRCCPIFKVDLRAKDAYS